jgi:hypothetical protein
VSIFCVFLKSTLGHSKRAEERATDTKQSPLRALQDHNTAIETLTPWSVRGKPSFTDNFKYSSEATTNKQLTASYTPVVEMASSPTRTRGRGRGEPVGICREDFEPAIVQNRESSDKVNYAKTMAKGYLRSVGIGEYTPQGDSYCRDPESPAEEGKTKWKRTDSDEFDF